MKQQGVAQVHAIIPKELKKLLDLYCVENEIKQKEVITMALEKFLIIK